MRPPPEQERTGQGRTRALIPGAASCPAWSILQRNRQQVPVPPVLPSWSWQGAGQRGSGKSLQLPWTSCRCSQGQTLLGSLMILTAAPQQTSRPQLDREGALCLPQGRGAPSSGAG